jgi:hypothetical protein
VIREAIDRLPAAAEERRSAIEAILGAAPMPVPTDPGELRRDLDAAHERTVRGTQGDGGLRSEGAVRSA